MILISKKKKNVYNMSLTKEKRFFFFLKNLLPVWVHLIGWFSPLRLMGKRDVQICFRIFFFHLSFGRLVRHGATSYKVNFLSYFVISLYKSSFLHLCFSKSKTGHFYQLCITVTLAPVVAPFWPLWRLI